MTTKINPRNTLFSIGIYPEPETNTRVPSRTQRLVDELYRNTLRRQKESDSIKKDIQSLKETNSTLRTEFNGVRSDLHKLKIQSNQVKSDVEKLEKKIKKDRHEDKVFDAKMRKRYKKTKYTSTSSTYPPEKNSEIFQIFYRNYQYMIERIEKIFTRITSALS